MKTLVYASLVSTFCVVSLGCSDFTFNSDEPGNTKSVTIPAFSKGLSEVHRQELLSVLNQVQQMSGIANDIDSTVLQQAVADIQNVRAEEPPVEKQPTPNPEEPNPIPEEPEEPNPDQPKQPLPLTSEAYYSEQLNNAFDGCRILRQDERNRSGTVAQVNAWIEPTLNKRDARCEMDGNWNARQSVSTIIQDRESITKWSQRLTINLKGSVRDNLLGSDLGKLVMTFDGSQSKIEPARNRGESMNSQDRFWSMGLNFLNGRGARLEASDTKTSRYRVISRELRDLKSDVHNVVLVYNGTLNPSVYKRTETRLGDGTTRVKVLLNDVIIFESKDN